MQCDHQFGVFREHPGAPVWKGFYNDLEEAKRAAQQLANAEDAEFYVGQLHEFSVIARFFPSKDLALYPSGRSTAH